MGDNGMVEAGKVVLIRYALKDEDGNVLDQTKVGSPLPYLHGAGNIVVGLEKALDGLSVGDTFEVSVSPAEGYGEKQSSGPQAVPKREFPKGANFVVGSAFRAQTANGHEVVLYVARVDDGFVYVDSDHPLAGKTLHFSGAVERVREASADEKAHGHAHGPDGTHQH